MLNERALEILGFIQRTTRERGISPTIREIGEQFGIASTNGVRYYINLLEKSGHVKRTGKISRGIVPVMRDIEPEILEDAGIPIVGDVAAGTPILAEQNISGHLAPTRLFGDAQGLYALKVRGDSMIDAGILDGDYVIVRAQSRANAGEIVVARVDKDEATVKTYRPRGTTVELVPSNATHQPIVVREGTELNIDGVVKGVIRIVK
jgi:repressor LexA